MPFVREDSAENAPWLALEQRVRDLDAAGGRVPLIGLPNLRCVLLRWEPGTATSPHRHPNAAEVFLILQGEVRAWIGGDGGPEGVTASSGTLMLAAPGQQHHFVVNGPDPAVVLALVAPNEDRADETVS